MASDDKTPKPTWLERVFDAPKVDFAGGVVSVITTLTTAGGYFYAAIYHPSEATAALVVTALLSIILTTGIAALSMAYAQKIRKIRRLSSTVNRLNQDCERLVADQVVTADNLNVIFTEFAKGIVEAPSRGVHFGLFVNRVQAIFVRHSSSGQAAVCIKLLKLEHTRQDFDGPYIWTAKRDDISALNRSQFDHTRRLRRYAPDENKAFSDIMSRRHGRDYFASNNLSAMGAAYFNSNERWRDFYNAAIVVPIKPCREDASRSAVGFLCVDSLDGIFEKDVSVRLLVLIAEIFHRHILNFPDTDDKEHPTG